MLETAAVEAKAPRRSLDELIRDRLDVFGAAYLNLVAELELLYKAAGAVSDALNDADPVTGLTPLIFSARNNAVQAALWLSRLPSERLRSCLDLFVYVDPPQRRLPFARGDAESQYGQVNHGAVVDRKGYGGKTALMHAVQCSSIPVLEILIQNKADVNAQDDEGMTAFMYAAANANMKVIDILANAGARIDQMTNASKSNALMMAVVSTQAAVVDLMTIRLGEPVSCSDVRGRTPLHHAVCLQSTGMIERLIRLGADRNVPDKQGKTSVDLATDPVRKAMAWT